MTLIKEEADALRSSAVAPAQRSKAAIKKQTTGVTPEGPPVHSFHTLLADLATMAAQHHRDRNQPALSADRGDAADAGAAEGVRSAGACGVASSERWKQHFLQYYQLFM